MPPEDSSSYSVKKPSANDTSMSEPVVKQLKPSSPISVNFGQLIYTIICIGALVQLYLTKSQDINLNTLKLGIYISSSTTIALLSGYSMFWCRRLYCPRAPTRLIFAVMGVFGAPGSVFQTLKDFLATKKAPQTSFKQYLISTRLFYLSKGAITELTYSDLSLSRVIRYQSQGYYYFFVPLSILLSMGYSMKVYNAEPLEAFALTVALPTLFCRFFINTFVVPSRPNSAKTGIIVVFSYLIVQILCILNAACDLYIDKRSLLKTQNSVQHRLHEELNFGPKVLKPITQSEINKLKAKDRTILVIDDIVHDVTDFLQQHPGGIKIVKKYNGTDASDAYNGEEHRHSKSAKNFLATMRLGRFSSR